MTEVVIYDERADTHDAPKSFDIDLARPQQVFNPEEAYVLTLGAGH